MYHFSEASAADQLRARTILEKALSKFLVQDIASVLRMQVSENRVTVDYRKKHDTNSVRSFVMEEKSFERWEIVREYSKGTPHPIQNMKELE